MKKRNIIYVVFVCVMLLLSACGESAEKIPENGNEGKTDASNVKREENITIIIPASFVGKDTTQEELDKAVVEKGFISAMLNEDGSATYVMSKRKHTEVMAQIRETIDSALAEMPLSESYPNVTAVSANEDYTIFTVTTKNEEPSLAESFGALALYLYGGMYNHYNGTPVDNVHVDFVNADSGAVIGSGNSKDMGE